MIRWPIYFNYFNYFNYYIHYDDTHHYDNITTDTPDTTPISTGVPRLRLGPAHPPRGGSDGITTALY